MLKPGDFLIGIIGGIVITFIARQFTEISWIAVLVLFGLALTLTGWIAFIKLAHRPK